MLGRCPANHLTFLAVVACPLAIARISVTCPCVSFTNVRSTSWSNKKKRSSADGYNLTGCGPRGDANANSRSPAVLIVARIPPASYSPAYDRYTLGLTSATVFQSVGNLANLTSRSHINVRHQPRRSRCRQRRLLHAVFGTHRASYRFVAVNRRTVMASPTSIGMRSSPNSRGPA
jgi:hypothetical protein